MTKTTIAGYLSDGRPYDWCASCKHMIVWENFPDGWQHYSQDDYSEDSCGCYYEPRVECSPVASPGVTVQLSAGDSREDVISKLRAMMLRRVPASASEFRYSPPPRRNK